MDDSANFNILKHSSAIAAVNSAHHVDAAMVWDRHGARLCVEGPIWPLGSLAPNKTWNLMAHGGPLGSRELAANIDVLL